MQQIPDPARLRDPYEDAGRPSFPQPLPDEPIELFAAWFADAVAAGLPEPNAMVLATADAEGVPSARIVLLKGYGTAGFRFFTNHTSRKGRDLAVNPLAALVLPWHAIRRQIRISGRVERLPEEESAAYFHTRPHGAQIGAWASRQSSGISSRDELDARYAEFATKWPDPAVEVGGQEVPLPPFWGGYLVIPDEIEFWHGRPDRLHDRIRYRRTADTWTTERLAP